MVLTPQLRQRIEMLQMTSMELNELIENEMVSNPILEEVMPGEEVQEISESILDQNADGHDNGLENGSAEAFTNGLDNSPANIESGEPYQAGEISANGTGETANSEYEGEDDRTPESSD